MFKGLSVKQKHIDALWVTNNRPSQDRVIKGLTALYGYDYVALALAKMRLDHGIKSVNKKAG